MPDKMFLEGESKDYRSQIFQKAEIVQRSRHQFSPFWFVSLIFFSILIAIVVMVMIVILVILKQGFGAIGGFLG